MNPYLFNAPRNSRMSLNEGYFWTDTIKDWKHLLKPNKYKELIIEELHWLKNKNKIAVYGFVIMPNHLHLSWEMLNKNGKEMPHASFNKFTASNFLKDLRKHHPEVIPHFAEKSKNRHIAFGKKTQKRF